MDILKLSQPTMFVASLRGKCEGSQCAQQLIELLREAVRKQATQVWLLCQELTHIDLGAQQTLLRQLPLLQNACIKLVLCGLPPNLVKQFESTGLAGLFALLPAEAYTGPRPIVR
ncbi:STAS domain-containing protein [Hymenobacter sp. BT635]|uniref:STAS domain-containing protein n=1 Tax=Hymenobacter nitidus TaxID=2880929 RepID=A0ABS8A7R9_9BACT|nr:STAS domain-containing protein [Hymenobacter nitidus]MCB2376448.1 STAS domain-containing protein [Hymenobacter nitidus]